MTLIDLFKVMDDDTKVAVNSNNFADPITGTVEDVIDCLDVIHLEKVVSNIYLSTVYKAIYITIE